MEMLRMEKDKQAMGRHNECRSFCEVYDPDTRMLTMTSVVTVNIKVPDGLLPAERKPASEMTNQELSTFFHTLWPAQDLLFASDVVASGDEKEHLIGGTGLYWPPPRQ